MTGRERADNDPETESAAVVAVRELMVTGRTAAALRGAEELSHTGADPYTRAQAHLQRVCALVNLGRTAQYTAAVDEAFGALQELTDPALHGHLHAVAALASRQLGAPERGLTHLVQAARVLSATSGSDSVGGRGAELAWGWHDLAMAYSYLGFHPHALSAIERAREIGRPAGVPPEHFAQPGIRLRMALSLDHHGDTDGCLRVLRDLGDDLHRYARDRVRPTDRVAYGYALARQAALAVPATGDPRRLLGTGAEGQRALDMRALGEVCLLIAAGQPAEARDRLDASTVSPDTLGPAEQARLRSLSYAAGGDHAAAHQADRYAFRLATARADRLRDVFLEGVAARLDHEDVRRSLASHSRDPMTDPLTGLANRAYLESYLSAMAGRGERAMVGVVDVDGLADINARHGRLSGDLVLQRLAGVMARVLRRDDLVARRGSDEFAVVLPDSSAGQATRVARRITEAVEAEDWATLVPGTKISVTVTWDSD